MQGIMATKRMVIWLNPNLLGILASTSKHTVTPHIDMDAEGLQIHTYFLLKDSPPWMEKYGDSP